MYSAYDNYYIVQSYQKTEILGIFSNLSDAKQAIEEKQAELGFYVRFEEVNDIVWANHFDRTVVYSIKPIRRDVLVEDEVKEDD